MGVEHGAEQTYGAPTVQVVQADSPAYSDGMMSSDGLAGREFELPAITESNGLRMLETQMPLMLSNVMDRREYKEQAEEINREFAITGADFVGRQKRLRNAVIAFFVVIMVVMIVGIVASLFTFGLAMIPAMVIYMVILIVYIVYVIYAGFSIKKARANQIAIDRAFLVEVSERWAPRGIAFRLREGAPVAVGATRHGRIISNIPMLVFIEMAPNAAQLFREQGPFPSSTFEGSNALEIELPAVQSSDVEAVAPSAHAPSSNTPGYAYLEADNTA